MQIRVGYELIYNCPQGTPMILIVNIHYSRASDIVIPDYLTTEPSVPITAYRDLFEKAPPGWARAQAICDYVHNHITFGYEYARVTKTAFEAFNERTGVCRDYTHLAVTLCRCMNVPARYSTGSL